MTGFLRQLRRRDDAATAVEYAIMLALILMVVLGAVTSLGTKNNKSWQNTVNSLDAVNVGGAS